LIHQKIEKVKSYWSTMNYLSEIADQLHYSSVQHLSTHLKKVTGLTPSHFKKIGAASACRWIKSESSGPEGLDNQSINLIEIM